MHVLGHAGACIDEVIIEQCVVDDEDGMVSHSQRPELSMGSGKLGCRLSEFLSRTFRRGAAYER